MKQATEILAELMRTLRYGAQPTAEVEALKARKLPVSAEKLLVEQAYIRQMLDARAVAYRSRHPGLRTVDVDLGTREIKRQGNKPDTDLITRTRMNDVGFIPPRHEWYALSTVSSQAVPQHIDLIGE